MKKNRNYFDFGINITILVLLSSNIFLLSYLNSNDVLMQSHGYKIFTGVFLLEAFIIISLIHSAYKSPIDYLQEHINDFISGNTKGTQINIKTNFPNPNIRYVLKFFDVILNSLKNIKEEFLSGKAIKGEVQLATELQEKLLNKKLETIPSIDIVAKSKPAGEIGGDSYDVIKEGDNYYVYVGDATGHGVGAGFVMVMVNALVSGFVKIFKSGSQILAHTNEILKPRVKSNILMTLLMVRWNEIEKRFFMTGAGHEYLIIYKNSQKKCYLVKSGGLALGMTKNVHKILKEQEIKFEIDDIAVLYTDGITEAINQNKKDGNEQMFGEQRLKESIEKAPELPGQNRKSARSVFNNITIELSKFMGYKHVQLDDVTLVVMHYRGEYSIENDVPETISKDFITERDWNN